MSAITAQQLDNWFTYHAPQGQQVAQYQAIRAAGRALAQVIVDNTPDCADQTAAIRKVREAIMTANSAIACGSSFVPHMTYHSPTSD